MGLGSLTAAARELSSRVQAVRAVAPGGGPAVWVGGWAGVRGALAPRRGAGPWGGALGAPADGDDDLRSKLGRSLRPHPVLRALHTEFFNSRRRSEVTSLVFHPGNRLKTAGILRPVKGRVRVSAPAVCLRICALDRYSPASGAAFSDLVPRLSRLPDSGRTQLGLTPETVRVSGALLNSAVFGMRRGVSLSQ